MVTLLTDIAGMPSASLKNVVYMNSTSSDSGSPVVNAATSAGGSSSWFLAPNSRQWTDTLPETEHVQLFLNTVWENTPLGPLKDWGPALRFAVTMMFADSRAVCIYWGQERTAIYNEHFKVLAVNVHPFLMGSSWNVAFPELKNDIMPIFAQVEATAETVDMHNLPLFTKRGGFDFLEEVYFTGQFIPLRGDDGTVAGVYNTCYESTEQVCLERSRKLCAEIAALPTSCVAEAFGQIIDTLRRSPHDVSMALLYSIDEAESASIATLRGSIGVPKEHMSTSRTLDLGPAVGGLARILREVKCTGKQLVLEYTHPSLMYEGEHLFEGIQWVGYGDPARNIVISPIRDNSGELVALLVHGTNPRRPFDRNMRGFVTEMVHQIEAKWLSSISSDEAQLREEALELQLTASERRLRELAHAAPLGMMQLDLAGNIQWANDQLYEVAGLSKSNLTPSREEYHAIFLPEDVEVSDSAFQAVLAEDRVVVELRLARMWQPPVDGAEPVHAWVLGTGYMVKGADGQGSHVIAFMSDISHQKWAESVQSRNAEAATLAKSQQEKFIDELSHEIRNPLMAMTQLADGVARSLERLDESHLTRSQYRSIVHENVEAAGTIVACAMHQKRMIDDVLILSRLESEMLSITPVAERPSAVVDGAVRMFFRETVTTGISMTTVKDPSFEALHVDYVLCDTSRLTQILINLLSNAFKFTSTQSIRKVNVEYGAQLEPPQIQTAFGEITWLAKHKLTRTRSHLPANTDVFYLYFVVQDTGPGLTSKEIERLFKRFSQASSKTYVTYGGTGLGLYICRELAEKQGGQVGVASIPGTGAAFAFYIETCCTQPEARRMSLDPLFALTRMRSGERVLTAERPTKGESADPSEAGSQGRADTTSANPIKSTPLSRKSFHVLLVEDNLINQKVLTQQLTRKNCTVTVANHGAEALRLLEQTDCWRAPTHLDTKPPAPAPKPIHIVLLDWEMPVMNGLECVKRIRELERTGEITRHLIVVGVTANTRDEQISQALAAGMDDVMPKPFTVMELLQKIAKVVGAVV